MIADFIKNQFPAVFREDSENLVAFMEAYYEYMEIYHSKNRLALESTDIDKNVSEFVAHFKKTYLKDFPYVSSTDTRFMIKNIGDFYSSKGTEVSTALLLKLLFGDETSIYYPGRDILKASDSKWIRPVYLEITHSETNAKLVDTEIVGTRSKARALVEGIVTKRVNGKYIDVMYISDVRGLFVRGENITADGFTKNAPQIIGSLSGVTIINGGKNNKIGDIFDVEFENGRYGKARVVSVIDSTGRVEFEIIDGGSGYTVTDRTKVYVSTAVVECKNPDLDFLDFEEVYQQIENLELLATDSILGDLVPGAPISGHMGVGPAIATGKIISVSSVYDPILTMTNSSVKVLVNSESFTDQKSIKFTAAAPYVVGEMLDEESEITVTIGSLVGPAPVPGNRLEQSVNVQYGALSTVLGVSAVLGTFAPEDVIYQNNANNELSVYGTVVQANSSVMKIKSVQPFASPGIFVSGRKIFSLYGSANSNVNTVTSTPIQIYTQVSSGTVTTVSGSQVTLNPAWGEFKSATLSKVYANSTSVTPLSTNIVGAVSVTEQGAVGKVGTLLGANTFAVGSIIGLFNTSKRVKGRKSKAIRTISTIIDAGATDIRLNNNINSNSIIDIVTDRSASGVIIGQNTTSVGIYSDDPSNRFYSSGDITIGSSLAEISDISFYTGNTLNIETVEDHNFTIGDNIKLTVDLQQNGEVRRIYGIYVVLSVQNSKAFRFVAEPEYSAIIQGGNFNLFSTSIAEKTIVIPLKTLRYKMISPPLRENGTINEINREAISVSTGTGANFQIGTIENAEVVFVDTDLIGDENIVGIPYPNIQITGANSGVGFIDSMSITSGGTGYANGSIITFTGGGYAGSDADIPAVGVISTTPLGVISDITMTDNGYGYYSTPVAVFPGGNNSAVVTVNLDTGYGFPKMPNGDVNTPMELLFTSEEFNIGTIASLKNINPGVNYNTNPFVRVTNHYIAGFKRNDFVVSVNGSALSYNVGETLVQEIPGDNATILFAKGYVLSTTSTEIIIRRTSFNVAFTPGYQLQGNQSGYSAPILNVSPLYFSRPMGDNADIEAIVSVANGIATSLEVVDSGYGYEHDESVNLTSDSNQYAIEAVAVVKNQGIGTGRWETETSHLNGTSHIHDNDYYQEHSYEVVTGKSIEKYEKIIKNLIHVAGNKFFGKVEKISKIKSETALTSSAEILGILDTTLALDLNFLFGSLDPRITFTRASTATYFGSDGLMKTAAVGVPRFDYDPVTLQPKGLLIEGPRTNLLLQSGAIKTAPWTTIGAITSTEIPNGAPDGLSNAYLFNDSDPAVSSCVRQTVAVANDSFTRAVSVYVKSGTSSIVSMRMAYTGGTAVFGSFTLNTETGVVAPTGSTLFGAKAENAGGGWWRISALITNNNTGNTVLDYRLYPTDSLVVTQTSSAYFTFAQVEIGAFPTSYIPTTTSPVSRAGEFAMMSGANFSNWFNDSEGTFVVEILRNLLPSPGSMMVAARTAAGYGPRHQIAFNGSNAMQYAVVDDTSGVVVGGLGAVVPGVGPNRHASTYRINDFAVSLNGAAGPTDVTGTPPTGLDALYLGIDETGLNHLFGHIRRLQYYRTRLANSELQRLTTNINITSGDKVETHNIILDNDGNAWVTTNNELMTQEQ